MHTIRVPAGLAVTAGLAVGLAPATPAAAETDDPAPSARHCVVEVGERPGDQTTLGCFDTLREAQEFAGSVTGRSTSFAGAPVETASSMTISWHYEHHDAAGSSIGIVAASCEATWYPSSWWADNMSSTRVASACSFAKHYTLSSCGGTYQLADDPYPAVENLLAPLNDNVHCVKYR